MDQKCEPWQSRPWSSGLDKVKLLLASQDCLQLFKLKNRIHVLFLCMLNPFQDTEVIAIERLALLKYTIFWALLERFNDRSHNRVHLYTQQSSKRNIELKYIFKIEFTNFPSSSTGSKSPSTVWPWSWTAKSLQLNFLPRSWLSEYPSWPANWARARPNNLAKGARASSASFRDN